MMNIYGTMIGLINGDTRSLDNGPDSDPAPKFPSAKLKWNRVTAP